MPGIFAFMGWDPQTPLRGRKGGFTPPYSYKYLFTGIRYNLRNAIKNGDVVKKFWNLLFLIPKTYKKHGKVVSCLENFFNPRDSSGQLWFWSLLMNQWMLFFWKPSECLMKNQIFLWDSFLAKMLHPIDFVHSLKKN